MKHEENARRLDPNKWHRPRHSGAFCVTGLALIAVSLRSSVEAPATVAIRPNTPRPPFWRTWGEAPSGTLVSRRVSQVVPPGAPARSGVAPSGHISRGPATSHTNGTRSRGDALESRRLRLSFARRICADLSAYGPRQWPVVVAARPQFAGELKWAGVQMNRGPQCARNAPIRAGNT